MLLLILSSSFFLNNIFYIETSYSSNTLDNFGVVTSYFGVDILIVFRCEFNNVDVEKPLLSNIDIFGSTVIDAFNESYNEELESSIIKFDVEDFTFLIHKKEYIF